MKVAVLSDIHDHVINLERVIEQIQGRVEAVVFCGDMCSPFTAGVLATLDIPIYACLGNNDQDQLGLAKLGGDKFQLVPLFQEFGEIELGGKKIAFCHYPKLAELLAKSGKYDAVFHGHIHESYKKTFNQTVFLNPGPVCGLRFDQVVPPSYAIYDTQTNSAEIFPACKI